MIGKVSLSVEEGIAIIPVKTDGANQKREDTKKGYTSKLGIILLTLILYFWKKEIPYVIKDFYKFW